LLCVREEPYLPQVSASKVVVRDLSSSQFERILGNASKLAIVFVAAIAAMLVLQAGRPILAPVFLAVVIGLMFGPVADWVERRGVPPALSAVIVVLLLLATIAGGVLIFAVPLSEWIARAPMIWEKLRVELLNLQEPLAALSALQDQVKGMFGSSTSMTVSVEDSSAVTDLALGAPAMLAELLIFLASLYFYVATRHHIQVSLLSLCVTRAMRWRTAHVFRDVERKVSRFLLSITVINIATGIAVGIGMWAIGMPSPVLWGALAAVLNYIPYVGQAIMVVILLAVGLGTRTGIEQILAPAVIYGVINFLEGQIITPQFMGRTLTLNPLVIFLAIAYWMWIWGPIGGLVAVPSLLILQSIIYHVLPSRPMELVRRRSTVKETAAKEEVLDKAAELIRAKSEEQAAAEAVAAAEAEAKPSMMEKILHPAEKIPVGETPAKPAPRRRRAKAQPAENAT
jgi:predicted PurR-regulated permease PerM